MPKATQTGQNIVACRVNGNVQIYTGPQTYLDEDGVSYGLYSDMGDLYISINATETDKVEGSYTKHVDGLSRVYRGKDGEGVIRFTRYDKDIVAGTFSFAAYKDGDKVNVTEGFFDIKVEK